MNEDTRAVRAHPAPSRALWAYVVAYFTPLLVLPVLHRGAFVHGWELLGAAEGYRLLQERGLVDAIAATWRRSRDYFYWSAVSSVPYAILPGLLEGLRPWLFWAQTVALAATALAVGVTARAAAIPAARLLFVAGAAPALAMFAVFGMPYFSILLVFALSLLLILRQARRAAGPAALLGEAALWALVVELALQSYEMSKTVLVLPFVAAVSLAGVPLPRRLAWAVGSAVCTAGALHIGGGNFAIVTATPLAELLALAPGRLSGLGRFLLLDWNSSALVVVPLAAIALLRPARDPWFWRLTWLAVLGPVVLLGLLGPEQLRTRRLLLLLFCSSVVIALSWERLTGTRRRRVAITSVLVLAHAASLATVVAFVRRPVTARGLPWTESPADFFLDPVLLRDTEALVRLVRLNPGSHVIAYGYSAYPENTTDPQALPERLLLELGWGTFSRRVFLIDPSPTCRYSCVTMYQPGSLPAIAQGAGGPFHVHVYHTPETTYVEDLWLGGSERYVVDSGLQRFTTYQVARYTAPVLEVPAGDPPRNPARTDAHGAASGLCMVEGAPMRVFEQLQRALAHSPSIPEGPVLRLDYDGTFEPAEPVSAHLWAEVVNDSPGPRIALLRAVVDDEVAVTVNGRVVLVSFGSKPLSAERARVRLPPGRSRLEAHYGNMYGTGSLRLELRDTDGRPLAMECP